MKNKTLSFILLITAIIAFTSCSVARSKYGCPAVTGSGAYRYR